MPENLEAKSESAEVEAKRTELLSSAKTKLRGLLSWGSKFETIEKIKSDISRSHHLLPGVFEDLQKILAELDDCGKIEGDAEFEDRVIEILKPAIYFEVDNPEGYQQIQQDRSIEEKKRIKINNLLYYGVGGNGDYIHLHVSEAEGRKDLIALMRDGMKKLAEIVRADENIKNITAASWIVASHPGILKRLGFKILGPVDEETRSKHFKGDTEPISFAVLSRKKLLEMYPA